MCLIGLLGKLSLQATEKTSKVNLLIRSHGWDILLRKLIGTQKFLQRSIVQLADKAG